MIFNLQDINRMSCSALTAVATRIRHLASALDRLADALGPPEAAMWRQAEASARREVEEALRISEQRFRGLFDNSLSGVALHEIMLDAGGQPCDYRFLMANRAFETHTGLRVAEIIGRTVTEVLPGIEQSGLIGIYGKVALTGEPVSFEMFLELNRHHYGITAFQVGQGQFATVFENITERKAAEKEIRDLAFFDPLTGLPNRRLLLDRLARALVNRQRCGQECALLFIDLDDFKTLNDTLGHEQGDLLLRQVAGRLSACLRESDTLSRFGGDEFVVMLEHLSGYPDEASVQVERFGRKLLAVLDQPYDLNGCEHHSTASIGITLFGDQPLGVDDLMRQADLAMYRAKAMGRNALRFFDPEMQAEISARAALAAYLRQALQQDQFRLVYQAQVEEDGRLIGAEALLRWDSPQLGAVSPATFIPQAEKMGLIVPLGQWVLDTACRQLARWSESENTAHLMLAVNISMRQFHQPDFVEQVLMSIARAGANPARLKLEITESLLLDNTEDVIAKMTTLNALGLGFSLDDFGTGYSSLSYLKRLPLDQLKIDRSFVQDVLTDANNAAIARTIIALAHSLELEVIAEGVETGEQRDWLAAHGCHAYQGYWFGRPVPAEDLIASF